MTTPDTHPPPYALKAIAYKIGWQLTTPTDPEKPAWDKGFNAGWYAGWYAGWRNGWCEPRNTKKTPKEPTQ